MAEVLERLQQASQGRLTAPPHLRCLKMRNPRLAARAGEQFRDSLRAINLIDRGHRRETEVRSFSFLAIGMPFFTARLDNENLKPAHEAGSRNQNP
jgi:hypothetical protein